MWETFAGTVLRIATANTRRNRLRRQVESQTKLLAAINDNAPDAASPLRELVRESVEAFVTAERAAMRRTVNVMNVVTGLILTVPTGAFSGWVFLRWGGWWKWPVLAVTGTWTLLWLIYAATVVYAEETDKLGSDSL